MTTLDQRMARLARRERGERTQAVEPAIRCLKCDGAATVEITGRNRAGLSTEVTVSCSRCARVYVKRGTCPTCGGATAAHAEWCPQGSAA